MKQNIMNDNHSCSPSKYLIINYFFITAIDGLLNMCGYPQLCKFSLLLLLAMIYQSIKYIKINGLSKIDAYIVLFSSVLILTSMANTNNMSLLWYGIRYQLLLMITGVMIGESSISISWKFMENALIPISIVSIIGLILFFMKPDWYIDFRMSNIDNQNSLLEMTRLSAFWEYPYWVSYGCAILYHFILYRLIISKPFIKYSFGMLGFLLVVILLAQQRAAIVFAFISTIFFILYAFRIKRQIKLPSFAIQMFALGLILLFAVFYMFENLNENQINFMLDKFVGSGNDSSNSFVAYRASLYDDFFRKGISFFGDGIGSYSHAALDFGRRAIPDHQYYELLFETGVFGLSGYLVLFFIIFMKAIKHLYYNLFEIGVLFFYFMAMLGADCLSSPAMHSVIFWICCGRILNKECLAYKKKNYAV